MLNELKYLIQNLHDKLDQLLAKEQPVENQVVALADGEIDKIVNSVVERLTSSAPAPVVVPPTVNEEQPAPSEASTVGLTDDSVDQTQ